MNIIRQYDTVETPEGLSGFVSKVETAQHEGDWVTVCIGNEMRVYRPRHLVKLNRSRD